MYVLIPPIILIKLMINNYKIFKNKYHCGPSVPFNKLYYPGPKKFIEFFYF
jgi:hypothetical protein